MSLGGREAGLLGLLLPAQYGPFEVVEFLRHVAVEQRILLVAL
jgi:hypothetical protein